MPAFITLMRWIRDVAYVEIKTAYDTYLTVSVGSTTNIDPVNGVVQPATVAYNPTTAVFDFGIPTSPIVDNTDASLIRADGTVPMDTTYVPTVAKDVMTKEASEESLKFGLATMDGTKVVDTAHNEGIFLADKHGLIPNWMQIGTGTVSGFYVKILETGKYKVTIQTTVKSTVAGTGARPKISIAKKNDSDISSFVQVLTHQHELIAGVAFQSRLNGSIIIDVTANDRLGITAELMASNSDTAKLTDKSAEDTDLAEEGTYLLIERVF